MLINCDSDSDEDIPPVQNSESSGVKPQPGASSSVSSSSVSSNVSVSSSSSSSRNGLSLPAPSSSSMVDEEEDEEKDDGSLFSALPQPKSKPKKKKKKSKKDKKEKKKKKKKKRKRDEDENAASKKSKTDDLTGNGEQQQEVQPAAVTEAVPMEHQHAIFSFLPQPKHASKATRLGRSGGSSRLNLKPSSSSSTSSINTSTSNTTTAPVNLNPQYDDEPTPTVVKKPEPPKPVRRKYQRRLPTQKEMMGSFGVGDPTAADEEEQEDIQEDSYQSHNTEMYEQQYHVPEVGPQRRGRRDTSYIDVQDPSLANHAMPDRSFAIGLQENPNIVTISGADLRDNSQYIRNVDLNKEQLQKANIVAPMYNARSGTNVMQKAPSKYARSRHHLSALAMDAQKKEAENRARQATQYKHRNEAAKKYGFY